MKRQFAASTPMGRRLTDANGVYFDRKTGHLFTVSAKQRFVLETTLAGAFVQTIDMPFCRMAQDPPVVASPTSCSLQAPTDRGGGPYLTDRGVDNDVKPCRERRQAVSGQARGRPLDVTPCRGSTPPARHCRSLSLQ
jgi:hypothetical protein